MDYINEKAFETNCRERRSCKLIGWISACVMVSLYAGGCGDDSESGNSTNENSPPLYAEYYVESATYDPSNNTVEVTGIYRPHSPIEDCSEIPTAEMVHELSVDDFEHFSDANNELVQPTSYIPISNGEFEDRAPDMPDCADVEIDEERTIMICDREWRGGFNDVDPTLDPPSLLKCSYGEALEGGSPIEPQYQSSVVIGCGYCQPTSAFD